MERYRHSGNVTPLRKIEALLKPIHGLTGYTDEMISTVQQAAERFYAGTGLTPDQFSGQRRNELVAAVHRLKNAVHIMEAQLPADISPEG